MPLAKESLSLYRLRKDGFRGFGDDVCRTRYSLVIKADTEGGHARHVEVVNRGLIGGK